MARLGEAHIEQIKTMRAEGKTLAEIKDFFKKTYQMKLYDGKIIEIAPKAKRVGKPEKRAYHKHEKEQGGGEGAAGPEQMIKDIVTLLEEIKNGYAHVFKHLRAELIRSRAEVCAMLTGAGIEPPESKIK